MPEYGYARNILKVVQNPPSPYASQGFFVWGDANKARSALPGVTARRAAAFRTSRLSKSVIGCLFVPEKGCFTPSEPAHRGASPHSSGNFALREYHGGPVARLMDPVAALRSLRRWRTSMSSS